MMGVGPPSFNQPAYAVYDFVAPAAPVPEPGSLFLLGAGLGLLRLNRARLRAKTAQ